MLLLLLLLLLVLLLVLLLLLLQRLPLPLTQLVPLPPLLLQHIKWQANKHRLRHRQQRGKELWWPSVLRLLWLLKWPLAQGLRCLLWLLLLWLLVVLRGLGKKPRRTRHRPTSTLVSASLPVGRSVAFTLHTTGGQRREQGSFPMKDTSRREPLQHRPAVHLAISSVRAKKLHLKIVFDQLSACLT